MYKLALALACASVLIGCGHDEEMSPRTAEPVVTTPPAASVAPVDVPLYEVTMLVKDQQPEGVHTLQAPRLTLAEGKPGSISLRSNAERFTAETVVRRESGESIATTRATIIRAGERLVMPEVTHLVGEDASVIVDNLSIHVSVRRVGDI